MQAAGLLTLTLDASPHQRRQISGIKGRKSWPAEEATADDPTSRSLAEAVEGAHTYSKNLVLWTLLRCFKVALNTILT